MAGIEVQPERTELLVRLDGSRAAAEDGALDPDALRGALERGMVDLIAVERLPAAP